MDRSFRWGDREGKRESSASKKRKREKVGHIIWVQIPLGNQTAGTQAGANEKKPSSLPLGLTPQPLLFRAFDGTSATISKPRYATRVAKGAEVMGQH